MFILTIRTDKPTAELGLYQGEERQAYSTWEAHRQLAETIHLKIKELLESQQHRLGDIQGIVVYRGPGSFTGLRIGLSVANTLAEGLNLPIVGEGGQTWLSAGIARLEGGQNDGTALPDYGSPPRTTQPKH